jgi:flagellar capping protein FliD
MNQTVMNLTATEGALGSRTKSLQDEKLRTQDQIAAEQDRVNQAQEQYYQQFANLDATVSGMQQSSNAIAALGETTTTGNPVTSLLPS